MSDSRLVLAAVIPALDRHRLTARCIETLRAATPGSVKLEIVLVDDGSTEPYRAGDFPGVVLVRNESRCGYTAATNRGIEEALSRSPDSILLLNNDLEFRPGSIARMLRALVEYDLAGPGGRLRPRPRIQPTHYLEFSCVLVRAGVFAKLGGLDPLFVHGYYSDDDFCLRARLAGFRLGQLAQCEPLDIFHLNGATFGESKRQWIERSFPIFMGKWGSNPEPMVVDYIQNYLWDPFRPAPQPSSPRP